MNFDELTARLDKLGISIPGGTIRRWSWQGFIEGPEATWKGPHGGRGRFMEWSERAVEEVAAVWAVGHNGLHARTPSVKMIEQIKNVVQRFYAWPTAVYTLPPIILAGPMRLTTLKLSSVKMQLTEDEQLHHLVVRWVIAIEKAKRQWPMATPARVVFRWISYKKAEDGSWKRNQKGDGLWRFELTKEEPITVTKSDEDELVLWIDGHDSRSYLPVRLEPD
jgi:hypothetical protein